MSSTSPSGTRSSAGCENKNNDFLQAESRHKRNSKLDWRVLSPAFIKKSIRAMATRCKKLFNAKGGLSEEGGKKKSR